MATTRRTTTGIALSAGIIACVVWYSVAVAATSVPMAHGSIVRDFARITFEWPDSVYFTATAEGNTVSVTFDRKANPDLDALLEQLRPYIKKAVRKPDGKTIVFTLNKPYRVRTFVSDNLNGIDLLEIDPKQQRVKKPAPPQQTAQVDATLLAGLSPAAGEAAAPAAEEKPAEATSPPVAAEQPAPAPAPAVNEAAAPPPVAVETAAPVAEAPAPAQAPAEAPATPTATAVAPPVDADIPVPLDYQRANIKKDANTVKIGLSASKDNATLRLPFPERVAMAVFIRNNKLWIVVNKPFNIDVSDFTESMDTVVGMPDLVSSEHSTIIRMPIDNSIYPIVNQETSSFNWAILLTNTKQPLASVLRTDISTDPPAPSHVFIPALEIADPISIYDPQIGDQLVITPIFKPGEGLAARREFVEFSLLETSQGIAIQKKSDDVVVSPLRNGLRISLPKGATISPGLPMVEQGRTQELLLDVATLFPYAQWKAETPNIYPVMQGLFRRVVKAPDEQAASNARLQMAQIYLGQGMAVEAIGVLEGIRRTNPAFYKSSKLSALQGAASFLMYRFADAARAFAASELNNNREIDFWRKVVSDLLGHPNQNYNFLEMNDDYISKYPPALRQRLIIVAADRSIYDKEYNTALKIFDTIKDTDLIAPISNYVNFLMATIAANNGQEEEAIAVWDKLAEDYSQLFVRASAELSRIMWGMGHEDLTYEEALERLERLRLAWHGDRLELQVMTTLGNMYEEHKDYVNAMRIWHGGILSFPNSAIAVDMTKKMQDAFLYMFSEGGADELPPIDVLAMYYEYQNYAPGGATGNELTEKLADRLISVDLLAQAAELLERQMRFQSEKEQRSQVGARLAMIHLINHQPGKALQALQDSLYGENSLGLRMLRNRLTAQALIEEGRTDRALQVLGQDNTPEAERIRLTIYWKEKDWDKVISSVEAMLKLRENITAPVTLDESESILKLALAYIFQNEWSQLQYLRDYFGPLMADNPYKPLFDFVTNSDVVVTTTNFDEVIQNLSNTRTFIENYKARIRTAGLAIPPANPSN